MCDISRFFFQCDAYSKDFSLKCFLSHMQPIFYTKRVGNIWPILLTKLDLLLNQLKSGKIWQDAHVAMSAPAALRKQKHFIKFASRPSNTKYHSSIYHNMA